MTELDELAALHDELRAVAADVLSKSEDAAVPWSVLARAGWTGLEIDESFDGAGVGFREVAVICEELGRAAVGSRFLGSTVLGVAALNAVPGGSRRDEILSGLASGSSTVAVALGADHGNVSAGIAFTVLPTDSGWRLQGNADFVPDAVGADHLLLLAKDPDGRVVVVSVPHDAGGLVVTDRPVVDETRTFGTVSAGGVVVAAESVWPLGGDPGALYDRAAIAVACDSLGLCNAMLAATVDYAGVRQQFGRAIGSFQAVKHACADMLVQITVARSLVSAAVAAVADGAPDAARAVSMAKSYAGAAGVEIAGKAMQLHGGIGYTWESGVHRYLKRAMLNRALFGSPSAHRQRLAGGYH